MTGPELLPGNVIVCRAHGAPPMTLAMPLGTWTRLQDLAHRYGWGGSREVHWLDASESTQLAEALSRALPDIPVEPAPEGVRTNIFDSFRGDFRGLVRDVVTLGRGFALELDTYR